jgi:xylose isomerase
MSGTKREFFQTVPKIKYDPNAEKTNCLVFRHYNPDELVLDRKMKDWLRL